jgi:hypothetical protein
MDHLVAVGFFIYAALFRLAVIATGVAAIVLGYKLFLRGVMGEGGTNVNAEAGPIKLTLHNAGPGGVFALFGAGIIIVMLSQGSPELLMREVKQLDASPQSKTGGGQVTQETLMKSGNRNEVPQRFEQILNEGKRLQQAGDIEAAITAYNKALSESEAPFILNELAWIYREQQRLDEALVLARAATTIDQKDPKCFDTLALILLDRKEHKAAEQAAEKAVSLDPDKQDYKATLQTIRAAQEAGQ